MTRYLGGLITKDESLVIPSNNFEDTSAPGVWTLEEAQALNKQGLWPTAGVSNPIKFVENIFSTHVWNGTGSDQSIANGIDLQNNDGLVWIKNRSNDNAHILFDSKRGSNPFEKRINSNNNAADHFDSSGHYIVPNSNGNGFTTKGNDAAINSDSSYSYVSWTWRATPKFFDVVTYTGDGSTSGRQIAHSLGSAPGMMIFKRTDAEAEWIVYHRSIGETKFLYLNATDLAQSNLYYFNNTAPTSTHFTLRNNGNVNASGGSYVAYLFGHDTSSDGMIQCGSFTTDSGSLATIDLGFEPQWVMYKKTNGSGQWYIEDTLRGLPAQTQVGNTLIANLSNAEGADNGAINLNASGFEAKAAPNNLGANNDFVYIAIRKAPMATPTSRSSVFAIATRGDTAPAFNAGFIVDAALYSITHTTYDRIMASRLQEDQKLDTSDNGPENTFSSFTWDFTDGFHSASSTSSNIYSWMFRRAPKFFDVVPYVGTGSAKTENHNLGVAPEMMWVKLRNYDSEDWAVYYGDATDYLKLNTDAATADDNAYWNDTAPTSTVFTVGTQDDVNKSGRYYIAYLFATLAGISKVGTFSHTNGSSTDVDCGFSSGSSFVIAKRTDSTGDWFLWDSTRGIISGNDPYVVLNSTAAQVTNTDYIDPLNSGFQIASGFTTGSYMFYAIAA